MGARAPEPVNVHVSTADITWGDSPTYAVSYCEGRLLCYIDRACWCMRLIVSALMHQRIGLHVDRQQYTTLGYVTANHAQCLPLKQKPVIVNTCTPLFQRPTGGLNLAHNSGHSTSNRVQHKQHRPKVIQGSS